MRKLTKEFVRELYKLEEFSAEFVREETKEKVALLFEKLVKPYFEGWKVNAIRNLPISNPQNSIRYEQQNSAPEEPMNCIITDIKEPEGY